MVGEGGIPLANPDARGVIVREDSEFHMRRSLLLTTLATMATMTGGPAHAGTSVGVSIDISQPGVYGRIDIGSRPPPAVVYAQPIVVAPTPVAVVQQPIYLYVPPPHQARWSRYCGAYAACGQPVYFVQETWVREHRGYRDDDRDDDDRRGKRRHKGKDKDRHHDRDD